MVSEVNHRIVARMRARIGEYKAGTLSLRRLSDDLEGSIRALDPSLPNELERRFFELFTVLDVAVATTEEEHQEPHIHDALDRMDSLLAGLA